MCATSRITVSKLNRDLFESYAKSISRMTTGAMAHAERKEQPVAHWIRIPKNKTIATMYSIIFSFLCTHGKRLNAVSHVFRFKSIETEL